MLKGKIPRCSKLNVFNYNNISGVTMSGLSFSSKRVRGEKLPKIDRFLLGNYVQAIKQVIEIFKKRKIVVPLV